MAKQTITKYVKKTGGKSGYMQCNICHGSGRVRIPNRKKKK